MIYVGTVHGDLKGPERLRVLLEYYKPRLISLELPCCDKIDTSLAFMRLGKAVGWCMEFKTKNRALRRLRRQFVINGGYELTVPLKYVPKENIRFVGAPTTEEYEEYGRLTRKELGAMEIGRATFAELRNRYDRAIDAQYDGGPEEDALRILGETEIYISGDESLIDDRKDEHMARMIKEIRPDMHIGGLAHIKPRVPRASLWEICHEPGDECIRLIDADKI